MYSMRPLELFTEHLFGRLLEAPTQHLGFSKIPDRCQIPDARWTHRFLEYVFEKKVNYDQDCLLTQNPIVT